ncbi:MAG: hypothetical protein HC781_15510 [Leptolyngbyaceae cyanobacterium CSU_1_4]|nr:hypothetical protein [Leptolyngbyaceae cyanobacterium CSU_1_4]
MQLPQPQLENGAIGTAITQAPTPDATSRSTFSSSNSATAAPSQPATASSRSAPIARPEQRVSQAAAPAETQAEESITQVDAVRMTGEGLLVQTRGATPDIKIEPDENDSRFVTLTIRNAQLANPELNNQRLTVNQFDVRDIEIEQRSRDRVRIKIQVARESGEWRATNISGGIAVLPSSRRVVPTTATTSRRAATVSQTPPAASPAPTASGEESATLEEIGFNETNSQLLIQGDRRSAPTDNGKMDCMK